MASFILFHSVLGLRSLELESADRLRALGHVVSTPDLYAGLRTESIEEGFAIAEAVGWQTIVRRAQEATGLLGPDTVLGGFSMGCGVVGQVWRHRPAAAGVLLMNAVCDVPPTARAGLPVQVHVADPDEYAPPEEMSQFAESAAKAGVRVELFTYPGVGHLFTDRTRPDYDAARSELAWKRIETWVAALAG